MVADAFKLALLKYRAGGGRLYALAFQYGMSPSLLSATISGARRCYYDERVVRIGIALGLQPADVFVDAAEDEVATS
jgi:hypothetical protein